MATAKVEEYATVGLLSGAAVIQAPEGPPLRVQNVTFTTSSGVTGNTLLPETRFVIVTHDAESAFCAIGFEDDLAATTADMQIFGGTYRGWVVPPGGTKYLAFIEP